MMSPVRTCAAAGAVLLIAMSPARADWTGKGNLGASFATGNSENQSVSGAVELKNKVDKWAHTVGFAVNYGNDGDRNTAERWELRGQTQYDYSKKAYFFGAARYEDDRFSAFDYQASLSAGAGYKIIDNERTKFWVQGGPGYRFAELQQGGKEDGVIFRGDLGLDHRLTETTKIVERFMIETGSDNTYMQNDIGLEVTITGALGLRVGYQVRHNTDVLPGVKKTDTLSTVGLLYETK
jgi:putative salt-induced outer membrane protein